MASEKDQKPSHESSELEVETREESRIARHIEKKITEVVPHLPEEAQLIESPESEFDVEEVPFFQQLGKILRTAGISKKAIFVCIAFFVFVVILLFFFVFDGISVFRKFFTPISTEVSQDQKPSQKPFQKPSLSSSEIGFTTGFSFGDYGGVRQRAEPNFLQNATVFGNLGVISDLLFDMQEIFGIAFSLGYRGEPTQRIGQYIANVGAIQNALNTDIFALLDKTSDRSRLLDQHTADLQSLLSFSRDLAALVDKEMATFKAEFDELKPVKNQAEKDFFQQVEFFHPQVSTDILEFFIDTSKKMVEFKSRNLALNKLRTLYTVALTKLDARIRDLQLNRDALIKGVRVFDVQESDLSIIVPEEKRLE